VSVSLLLRANSYLTGKKLPRVELVVAGQTLARWTCVLIFLGLVPLLIFWKCYHAIWGRATSLLEELGCSRICPVAATVCRRRFGRLASVTVKAQGS
jgi:hypothetical protein